MRYRQIAARPEPGVVERITLVPRLPDGTLGALRPADDDAAHPAADRSPGAAPLARPAEVEDPQPVRGRSPSMSRPILEVETPLVLIHGEVGEEEDWLVEAVGRIAAEQAGLELGAVQVVGSEGLPAAQHLIVWAQGWPDPQASEHASRLEGLAPGDLRRRVSDDQGLIPGGASAAWIVSDVAATIARREADATGGPS